MSSNVECYCCNCRDCNGPAAQRRHALKATCGRRNKAVARDPAQRMPPPIGRKRSHDNSNVDHAPKRFKEDEDVVVIRVRNYSGTNCFSVRGERSQCDPRRLKNCIVKNLASLLGETLTADEVKLYHLERCEFLPMGAASLDEAGITGCSCTIIYG